MNVLTASGLMALMALCASALAAAPAASTRIVVSPDQITGRIDPMIYGHFLEHIYHSVEDGLYGELVRNRAFARDLGITRDGDRLVLTTPATDTKTVMGDPSWTDYEFTVRARKASGAEGFLILVRATDDRNFYWWNLGGWGNTGHQLEVEKDDNRRAIGTRVPGSMEAGRWYDIRMRVEGDHIQGWVDDKLLLDLRDATHTRGGVGVGFWATSGEYRDLKVADLQGNPLPLPLEGAPDAYALPPEWQEWPGAGAHARIVKLDGSPNTGVAAQVTLADGVLRGISQRRVNAVKGRSYPGSIWASATGRVAQFRVSLLDREGKSLAQQKLAVPGQSLAEMTFDLRPSRSETEAVLVVEASGQGLLNVDMVTMTRDDYVASGCRTDLLEAVKALKPPIIRWPGGCFASIYRWKRGVGPQHGRKPFHNYVWGEWDSCGFGIDEYMRMCRIVGAEPMMVVNLGSWDDPSKEEEYIREALDWIEYCNGDADTPMGALRAANGHPEPYNVTHWEMDNETWGLGVERYGKLVARVAARIRARWSGLKIHACTFFEKEDPKLLELCAAHIDYISYHFYEDPNRYATAPASFENLWKRYARMIAASPNPKVRISVTEWNAQSTDWRTGLFAGGYLNVMERSSDVVRIATPALFLRRVDATAWDNAFINHDHLSWFPAPNYVVMKLYRDHFQPLRVSSDGGDGLNVVATRSPDGKRVVVKVVNASDQAIAGEIAVSAPFTARKATAYRVAARLDDRNTMAEPRRVAPAALPVSLKSNRIELDFPPLSVTVIEMQGAGLKAAAAE